jgi:hypothetical protein
MYAIVNIELWWNETDRAQREYRCLSVQYIKMASEFLSRE